MKSLFDNMSLNKIGIHFAYVNGTQDNLCKDIFLPLSIKNSSLKRQVDFIAGRKAAKYALNRLNPNIETNIGMDSKGLPAWPAGITGSISHSDGVAIAAVASTNKIRSLGIDLEPISSLNNILSLSHIILSPLEHSDSLSPTDLLLKFSAKESVYKCLFPIIKKFIEFTDCTINIKNNNYFTASLNKKFNDQIDFNLKGIFNISPNYIVTVSWIPLT